MKQWATKQIKTEIHTTRAAAVGGIMLAALFMLALCAFSQIKEALRTHDVTDASLAQTAAQEGWIARVDYSAREHLGSVTVETTSQGELTFMMGGAVGAVPGAARTSEQDYQLWALKGNGFTALMFSKAAEIPASGTLEMDSAIEWLTEADRQQLTDEFSAEDAPAYVFLLTENSAGFWFEAALLATLLIGAAVIVWMCKSRKAMQMTKFWKKLAKAGDAEKILAELDEPLFACMGLAVSTNYVCLSECVIPRAGMICRLKKDAQGDEQLAFAGVNGETAVYYAEDEDMEKLRKVLKIEE